MKALTVCQPYASLIVGWPGIAIEDIKQIENRNWKTSYRGPLLIHAGTRPHGWRRGADRCLKNCRWA